MTDLTEDLLNPGDSLAAQNTKLRRIASSLMRKVEQAPDQTGLAYGQFERAALLEEQVRQRTGDLERALDLLHQSNARVALANSQAQEARENVTHAIETIDDGFAMFDEDERLVMFNSRFCKSMPDVRAKLCEGTSFAEYVRRISESAHLAEPADDTSRSAWRSKRMRLHRKDRAVFNIRLPENRWMQVSEHRTKARGTVVLQTDVTQIMRMEHRARSKLIEQRAQMLRGTLDHLNQGVCIFDGQGCLVGWNQLMDQLLHQHLDESLRGMSIPVLLNKIDTTFSFSQDFGRADLENWAQAQMNRRPLRFEVTRTDGAILDIFAQEMPDNGFVISFTDVTQERHTAKAIRDLNETLERRVEERTTALGEALETARLANVSKDRFVAAASHDLLQPLSAAKLYAASLEEHCGDEQGKTLARKAISALSNAEALIDALMDISKLDLGLADFELVCIRVDSVLSALASEFAPIAEEKGITLSVMPTSLTVVSDPMYLRRILQNLIANALRYSTGDKVVVGARRRGGRVRVDVVDQGPGISEDDQALIFQEFKQLQRQGASGEGLGLGLAIVERACKLLGHDLRLRSRPGRGSRFSITLDAGQTQSAPSDDARPRAPQARTSLQARIVGLVENDTHVAQSITAAIEMFGSEVIHAPSAQEALALVEELGILPDGWLLDYQLGDGVDGIALAQTLRQKNPAIPIQIISANRSATLLHRCATEGLPLCRKPVTREDLHAFLATLAG
ncbi:MAG: PAS-domain containing protein [Pseudomonadota bacterium]